MHEKKKPAIKKRPKIDYDAPLERVSEHRETREKRGEEKRAVEIDVYCSVCSV